MHEKNNKNFPNDLGYQQGPMVTGRSSETLAISDQGEGWCVEMKILERFPLPDQVGPSSKSNKRLLKE